MGAKVPHQGDDEYPRPSIEDIKKFRRLDYVIAEIVDEIFAKKRKGVEFIEILQECNRRKLDVDSTKLFEYLNYLTVTNKLIYTPRDAKTRP